MASSSRLPHSLDPILVPPPEDSLVLLTSTLSASSSWLLLRYLSRSYDAGNSRRTVDSSELSTSNVILISFLHEWEFWREGARRLGMDLDQFCQTGHFSFIDGLTELFGPRQGREHRKTHPSPGITTLGDQASQAIQESLTKCSREALAANSGQPILFIEGLDLLLACTAATPIEILEMVMVWREHASATIITASADQPLLQAPSLTPFTPLERDHAAFVASLAQQASFVVSLRPLSTGVAKDVSGVIRITRGTEADKVQSRQSMVEEKELLYNVQADGNVRVFEKGEIV